MPLFAYSVTIDGGALRRLEITAASLADAHRLAYLHHQAEGHLVTIGRVFRAPARRGSCVAAAAAPLPRINYRREMYSRVQRRERRA